MTILKVGAVALIHDDRYKFDSHITNAPRRVPNAIVRLTTLFLALLMIWASVPAKAQSEPFLLISDWAANNITEFDANGNNLGVWATTGSGPAYIEYGPSGNLFASLLFDNSIQEFSPTGVDLGTFATVGVAQPNGLEFDSAGILYVANFTANNVTRYDSSGNFLGIFASGLLGPREIEFDSQGNLYVAERSANRVRKISPDGTTLSVFVTTGSGPFGLAFDDSNNLYVGLEFGSVIQYFDSAGNPLGNFASTFGGNSASLEFGPDGNLYLANATNDLLSWEPNGTALGVFADTFGWAAGQIRPTGIAFGADENIETVFVTVLNVAGLLCFTDVHTTAPALDPKEELSDGMDFAAVRGFPFRGIMRRDAVDNRGLSTCSICQPPNCGN